MGRRALKLEEWEGAARMLAAAAVAAGSSADLECAMSVLRSLAAVGRSKHPEKWVTVTAAQMLVDLGQIGAAEAAVRALVALSVLTAISSL